MGDYPQPGMTAEGSTAGPESDGAGGGRSPSNGPQSHEAAAEAYHDVFANNHAIMLLIDPTNGDIVDANPAALRFYGYSHEQLTHKRITDLNTLPVESVHERMKQAVGGQRHRFTFRHRLAGGEECDVEVYSGPVTFSGRRLLFSIIHDISERRRAEEALERSELKYRIVAENTYDWEFWQGPEGALLYCSPSCERITGYQCREFEADPSLLERIVLPEDLPRFRAHRTEERLSGLMAMEFRIVTKDGKVRWLEHVCQPVHGPDGAWLGTRATNRDATGRKLAEQERSRLLAELKASSLHAEEMAAYLQRERDILQAVMENTTTHLAYLDAGFNFIAANNAYVRGAGYSREVLIGRNHFELYPNEENQAIFEHVRDSGKLVRFVEKPFKYVDQPERGVTYWDWTLAPVGEAGAVRGLVLSLTDVSERVRAQKRIEDLAREAEERAGTLTAIIDSMADAVLVYGPMGDITLMNPMAEATLDYSQEERRLPIEVRLSHLHLGTGEGRGYPCLHFPALRALRGETVMRETLSLSRRGRVIWMSVSAAPIRDSSGAVNGAVAIMQDVTEARAAQERLEQRNSALRAQGARLASLTQELEAERGRLTAIIANAPQAIVVTDEQGRIALTNPVADRLLAGAVRVGESLLDLPEQGFCHGDGQPCQPSDLPLAISAREGATFRGIGMGLIWPNGERRHVTMSSAPIRDQQGGVSGAVAIMEDVTESREAEREHGRLLALVEDTAIELQDANEQLQVQAAELWAQKDELIELTQDLRAERERLAVTLGSIGDGVLATDAQGDVKLMNRVAEALTGWQEEEAIGQPLRDVFNVSNERTGQPIDDPLHRAVENGEVVGPANHAVLASRQGDRYYISHSVAPIRDSLGRVVGAVLVFQDVTERRKLEDEVAKANKLEALGLLAGGIAHDFNNLLTAILGNVVLAKIETEPQSEVAEILAEAERAAARARDLTQQLLTFARGGAPIRRALSLPELLSESSSFTLRGSNSSCEFAIADDLWPVEVDEGQISQVVQNLVINADEAMPTGGSIKVSAENVVLTEGSGLPLPAGSYVKVSVTDQGVGILPEHLGKVFDPYFTTKQKGSGLGLASCYSIIKRHEGHISVDSEYGTGTTFSIYLPVTREVTPAQAADTPTTVCGHGHILVMDDERVVRNVLQRMLGRLGYHVECACDGHEAVEMYRRAREEGQAFDAVIMDLTVPGGMGGLEAMSLLRQFDPAVKAIVSSGYSNDPVMSEYRRYGFRGVMSKPYRIEELGQSLRRLTIS
ncbi:MAG: PAS domain S-box protein [Anaerolineae bacterium]